jgi:ABC-2 type transport system permease protein
MHFMVPMMYPFSRVAGYADSHPVMYQIYMANPVADAVILLQRFFWQGVNVANGQQDSRAAVFPPNMLVRGVITLAACLVLLVIAQRIFTRLENKLPERL